MKRLLIILLLAGCASSAKVAVVGTDTPSTSGAATSKAALSTQPDIGKGDDNAELLAAMGAVSKALSLTGVDAKAADTGAMLGDCAQGKLAVRQMLAILSNHDGPITAATTAGLIEYRAGFDACLAGDYNGAAAAFDRGTPKIDEATAAMAKA